MLSADDFMSSRNGGGGGGGGGSGGGGRRRSPDRRERRRSRSRSRSRERGRRDDMYRDLDHGGGRGDWEWGRGGDRDRYRGGDRDRGDRDRGDRDRDRDDRDHEQDRGPAGLNRLRLPSSTVLIKGVSSYTNEHAITKLLRDYGDVQVRLNSERGHCHVEFESLGEQCPLGPPHQHTSQSAPPNTAIARRRRAPLPQSSHKPSSRGTWRTSRCVHRPIPALQPPPRASPLDAHPPRAAHCCVQVDGRRVTLDYAMRDERPHDWVCNACEYALPPPPATRVNRRFLVGRRLRRRIARRHDPTRPCLSSDRSTLRGASNATTAARTSPAGPRPSQLWGCLARVPIPTRPSSWSRASATRRPKAKYW